LSTKTLNIFAHGSRAIIFEKPQVVG